MISHFQKLWRAVFVLFCFVSLPSPDSKLREGANSVIVGSCVVGRNIWSFELKKIYVNVWFRIFFPPCFAIVSEIEISLSLRNGRVWFYHLLGIFVHWEVAMVQISLCSHFVSININLCNRVNQVRMNSSKRYLVFLISLKLSYVRLVYTFKWVGVEESAIKINYKWRILF